MADFRKQYIPPADTKWRSIQKECKRLSIFLILFVFALIIVLQFNGQAGNAQAGPIVVVMIVVALVLNLVSPILETHAEYIDAKLFDDWFLLQHEIPDEDLPQLLFDWRGYQVGELDQRALPQQFPCIVFWGMDDGVDYYVRVSQRVYEVFSDYVEETSRVGVILPNFMENAFPELFSSSAEKEGK